MKYNVFDSNDNYLGVIHGNTPEEAIAEAKEFDMPTADHVVERGMDDIVGRT